MPTPDMPPRLLPMASQHKSADAEFQSVAGWSVPAHFGDPEREYTASVESVALLDASFLSVVEATGKDQLEYLNRRLSQRVIDMQPGIVLRANQLNAEGRMEADFEVLRLDDSRLLFLAPPSCDGEYLAALADKYVFAEDCKYTNATGRWCAFTLFGPRSGDVLKALALDEPATHQTITTVMIEGVAGWLLRSELLAGGYVVLFPEDLAQPAYRRILDAVLQAGGSRLGFLAFDTLRIEHGVPWWGIDLTDRSIPLEADLMSAIHTNKGCYPGQETIAKILNLGHPPRKLVGVVWEGEDPLSINESLHVEGREIGRLTSSSYSPRLKRAIGLAMVRWQHREAGSTVNASSGARGRIVSLPME